MHPNYDQIKEAISALENCHTDVELALGTSDILPIKSRILSDLSRNVKYLKMQVGELDTALIPHIDHAPITRMFGQDIIVDTNKASKKEPDNQPRKVNHITSPTDVEVEELKAKLEELVPKFPFIENEAILDSYSDIEIRSVAKLAGLPVTETEPKNLNTGFIQDIKDAMKKAAELKAAGNPETDTTTEDAAKELQLKVDNLFPMFSDLTNEQILADHEEVVIRSVAKLAGLPWTDEDPKKITSKNITAIKDAMKKA